MVVSRGEDGKVNDEVQGEEFPEEQVNLLLSGSWHQVDWISLVQKMDLWTEDAEPDEETSLKGFATLTPVSKFLTKTMEMLRLARDSDSEEDPCTCIGFMAKIIRLERRGKTLPKNSPARKQALDNMMDTFHAGLKEFGARWAKQWAKPTNYSQSVMTSFADKTCFVMRKFDKLEKFADTMHEFKEMLPVLFEGGAFHEGGQHKEAGGKQSLAYKQGSEGKVPGRQCLLLVEPEPISCMQVISSE